MNYYNPYFGMYPYMNNTVTRPGIFGKLLSNLKGINFSSILSGTQKTLGIVNQTIPLVKQATPIVKNARTMFKVMNEFKRIDNQSINNKKSNIENNIEKKEIVNYNNSSFSNNNGPTFFL